MLNFSQVGFLLVVASSPDLNITELSHLVGSGHRSAGYQARNLEKEGLVTVERPENKKDGHRIALTDKGREALMPFVRSACMYERGE